MRFSLLTGKRGVQSVEPRIEQYIVATKHACTKPTKPFPSPAGWHGKLKMVNRLTPAARPASMTDGNWRFIPPTDCSPIRLIMDFCINAPLLLKKSLRPRIIGHVCVSGRSNSINLCWASYKCAFFLKRIENKRSLSVTLIQRRQHCGVQYHAA